MKRYYFDLIEKTVVTVEIEANGRDEAESQVEDMMNSVDMDWGMGGMETEYIYRGEEYLENKNA